MTKDIVHEVREPHILILAKGDGVIDRSRPFRMYPDAFQDIFEAAFEQPQLVGTIRPTTLLSRVT